MNDDELATGYLELARLYRERLRYIELSTPCVNAMIDGRFADEVPKRYGRLFDIPFHLNEALGIGEFVAVWA